MIGQTITSHLCEKLLDQSEFVLFIILRDNFPWSESQHVCNDRICRIFQTHLALLLLLVQRGVNNMRRYEITHNKERVTGNILSIYIYIY